MSLHRGISAVILNWQRPELLQGIILPVIERYALIDEIIISHGREDTAFEWESSHCRVINRQDWGEINDRYGIFRRWVIAADASNDTILSLDDDILVPESSLTRLYEKFQQNPAVIHSLKGRATSSKLVYRAVARFGEVALVLPQCALVPREIARVCVRRLPLIQDWVEERLSSPMSGGNGDDLFLSLVAVKHTGKPNIACPLPFIDLQSLSNIPGVCVRPGHIENRSKIIKLAIERLEIADKVKKFLVYRPSFHERIEQFLRRVKRIVRPLLLPERRGSGENS